MDELKRDSLLDEIEKAMWIANSLNLPFVVHILAMALLEAMQVGRTERSRHFRATMRPLRPAARTVRTVRTARDLRATPLSAAPPRSPR